MDNAQKRSCRPGKEVHEADDRVPLDDVAAVPHPALLIDARAGLPDGIQEPAPLRLSSRPESQLQVLYEAAYAFLERVFLPRMVQEELLTITALVAMVTTFKASYNLNNSIPMDEDFTLLELAHLVQKPVTDLSECDSAKAPILKASDEFERLMLISLWCVTWGSKVRSIHPENCIW